MTLATLSKAFGLPGLRVGRLIAPPEVIRTCLYLRDYMTLRLSHLIELAARRANENADRLLALRLPPARDNLKSLRDWASRHEERVEWFKPQGVSARSRA